MKDQHRRLASILNLQSLLAGKKTAFPEFCEIKNICKRCPINELNCFLRTLRFPCQVTFNVMLNVSLSLKDNIGLIFFNVIRSCYPEPPHFK